MVVLSETLSPVAKSQHRPSEVVHYVHYNPPVHCEILSSADSSHLLRLLRGLRARDIAVNISLVVGLLEDVLGGLPTRADRRWDVLTVGVLVTAGGDLLDHALDESALADAGAQEHGVEHEDDPASLGEDDRREQNAEPKCELETGDEGHAGVVVFADELGDGLAQGAGSGLLAGSAGGWCGCDGGKEDAAGVGEDVEDAVDGIWSEGEDVLAVEEPDEGHDQILNILVSRKGQRADRLAGLLASAEALVDDDSVGDGGRDEGGTVAELCPSRGEFEKGGAQAVSQGAQEQGDMAGEPGELESLSELDESVLQRRGRGGAGVGHGSVGI